VGRSECGINEKFMKILSGKSEKRWPRESPRLVWKNNIRREIQ
jgi:hypothetical protein